MPITTSDSTERLKKYFRTLAFVVKIMDAFMDKLKFWYCRTNRFHKVIAALILIESGILPGSQYGFYCGDPALSYPYTGDTVGWKWLVATAIALPFFVMQAVEKLYYSKSKKCASKNKAWKWYEEYIYGLLLNITVIEATKLMVGTPRPHFFDTCRPKEAHGCSMKDFVSRYHCTKSAWLKQSDRSFPSGHTSLVIHCSFFIAYYLHKRVPDPSICTRLIQLLLAVGTALCAVSRYTDRRHHIVDIAAGTIIGAALLFYTIVVLCKSFEIGTEVATQLSTEFSDRRSPKCGSDKRKKTKLEKHSALLSENEPVEAKEM